MDTYINTDTHLKHLSMDWCIVKLYYLFFELQFHELNIHIVIVKFKYKLKLVG